MPFPTRLRNELARMQRESNKTGIRVEVDDGNTSRWLVSFTGPQDSLFAGEALQLQFLFPVMYPLEPPDVRFVGDIPVHPHVYSDGQICLSILASGWTPELTVESIVVSLISMLASCSKKTRPPDDRIATSRLFKLIHGNKASFHFHDDNI